MWSEYLPFVFRSAIAAALSMPPAILSPCWSTALLALPLTLSMKPTACSFGRRLRRHPAGPCHTSRMSAVPIVAVVGPTASGKTALSLDLAEALEGEIVNTDAMQVYRGMDIGTAKLPPADRRGIPHHLLDILTVRDP